LRGQDSLRTPLPGARGGRPRKMQDAWWRHFATPRWLLKAYAWEAVPRCRMSQSIDMRHTPWMLVIAASWLFVESPLLTILVIGCFWGTELNPGASFILGPIGQGTLGPLGAAPRQLCRLIFVARGLLIGLRTRETPVGQRRGRLSERCPAARVRVIGTPTRNTVQGHQPAQAW
jgi:hypothetical protein